MRLVYHCTSEPFSCLTMPTVMPDFWCQEMPGAMQVRNLTCRSSCIPGALAPTAHKAHHAIPGRLHGATLIEYCVHMAAKSGASVFLSAPWNGPSTVPVLLLLFAASCACLYGVEGAMPLARDFAGCLRPSRPALLRAGNCLRCATPGTLSLRFLLAAMPTTP